MLNKDKIRELAYLVNIDSIEPIMGSDNCEAAVVGGWRVMVRKGTFAPGDLAIYFEIDSQVPATEPFAFLASKHYKVKSQRYTFGGKGLMISQGLLMAPEDLGFSVTSNVGHKMVVDQHMNSHVVEDESRFLTKELGVTYATPEDRKRKAAPADKYKAMAQRHPNLFKNPFIKYLMKKSWGKKLLFFFFGRKKISDTAFPTKFPYVKITDEERVENMPWVLQDKRKLLATEKLDGTSTTYILERKRKKKFEFYVVSRRVRQLTPNQKCYHNDNIYWNMAFKYDIEQHLKDYLLKNPNLTYVCLQGESVGSVQGNPLKLTEDDFYGYNFIRSDVGRISSLEGKKILENWGMKWVPIVDANWINPDTMDEMKMLATGKSLVNPNVYREGLVYRDVNDNNFSFKNVSNEFLLSKKG